MKAKGLSALLSIVSWVPPSKAPTMVAGCILPAFPLHPHTSVIVSPRCTSPIQVVSHHCGLSPDFAGTLPLSSELLMSTSLFHVHSPRESTCSLQFLPWGYKNVPFLSVKSWHHYNKVPILNSLCHTYWCDFSFPD